MMDFSITIFLMWSQTMKALFFWQLIITIQECILGILRKTK